MRTKCLWYWYSSFIAWNQSTSNASVTNKTLESDVQYAIIDWYSDDAHFLHHDSFPLLGISSVKPIPSSLSIIDFLNFQQKLT